MPHDLDPRIGDRPDAPRHAAASLKLHGVHVRLLEKTAGVEYRILVAHLVAEKGHVADAEGIGRSPPDRLAVTDAVFHRDRDGAFVTEHHHSQRIPYEDHVHPGRLGKGSRREVVGSDPRGEISALLHLKKLESPFFLGHGKTSLR